MAQLQFTPIDLVITLHVRKLLYLTLKILGKSWRPENKEVDFEYREHPNNTRTMLALATVAIGLVSNIEIHKSHMMFIS